MFEQPAAARFVTAKLWKEFVSPQPDAREVERIAGRFRASGYDIAVVVRELLLADAFWDDAIDFRQLYATVARDWWGVNPETVVRGDFEPLRLLRT